MNIGTFDLVYVYWLLSRRLEEEPSDKNAQELIAKIKDYCPEIEKVKI